MDVSLAEELSRYETLKPRSLTFITTYKCTAACAECCFECHQKIKGRLSLDFIVAKIDEAVESFDALEVVVFTGGECFLLGKDLFAAIAHCTARGLKTRCVSNGYWGKIASLARSYASQLRSAGLTEINFSTGVDHAEWVPVDWVISATEAIAAEGIPVLITVEKDQVGTDILHQVKTSARLSNYMYSTDALVSVVTNIWMPFHSGASERLPQSHPEKLEGGCKQLFSNIVITPHKRHSACCGLTLEHIPEMHLGNSGERTLKDGYDSQFDDFLKLWIHTEGPSTVIRQVLGDSADAVLEGVVHTCQACAVLHQNQQVIQAIASAYTAQVPAVLTKLKLSETLSPRSSNQIRSVLL